mgnify:CR=1 FL=1
MGLSRYRQPQAVPSEIYEYTVFLKFMVYSVSEIYEFTGGKHFKFMEITELRVYREIDGLFTELSIYRDKFLKFMGIRVSQVAFY